MRNNQTRKQLLIKVLNNLYLKNKDEIDSLPTTDPMGGRNAMFIRGWSRHKVGVLTNAAHISIMPTLPYWSGPEPTATSALPSCIIKEALAFYKSIFTNDV